jgi:iron complex outermembrane receptor protein
MNNRRGSPTLQQNIILQIAIKGMEMRKAYLGGVGLAALLLAAHSGPAFAATAAAADEAASTGKTTLQEVVVTARRREESAQKVPATVAVLTAKAIVQQGLHAPADLQSAVPGLIVKAGNTNNLMAYSIRGESLDTYSGSAPGVQPYIDEVPVSGYTPTPFYDLGNVQVLKGPQGTLFGRNSTGGAVLFTTQQPTDTFGGYASIQYGNLDKLITEAAVNLPLVKDKILLRIAGTYSYGGAYEHNIYDNLTLGNSEITGIRATLLLRPTDNFTNVTTVENDHNVGTNTLEVPGYVQPCGTPGGQTTCNLSPSNPAYLALINSPQGTYVPGYPGDYALAHFDQVFPADGMAGLIPLLSKYPKFTADANGASVNKALNMFVGNTSTYEVNPSLTFKNIFGYNRVSSKSAYDDDGTPWPTLNTAIGQVENTTITNISDEFQVQGKAFHDRLTYLAGFFYNHQEIYFDSPLFTTLFGIIPDQPFVFNLHYGDVTTDTSYAFFTQATYAITDKLNFTGGIRQTWDDLSQREGIGTYFYGNGLLGHGCPTSPTPLAPMGQACAPGDTHPLSTSENDQSWTVSIDYHITPELMTFITTRGSWRVGGYAPAAPPLGDTTPTAIGGNFVRPETIRDVEGGFKYNGYIESVPVQANVSVYNTWVTDIQKTADVRINGQISSSTINVPAAQVFGVETELQVKPTSWLRLGGNFAYTNARFTQPNTFLYGAPVTFGPYGDTPVYSQTVFAEITVPLPNNDGTIRYGVNYYGQSSFHIGNLGNTISPGDVAPGYGLLDMRLDWSDPFGLKGLTASGFVKNLTNKVYFTGGASGVPDGSIDTFNFGQPRTYGFVVRYDF